MKNIKNVWLVSGWDGDEQVFENKENAYDEFTKRLFILDDYDYLERTCEDKEENFEYWTARDKEGQYYYELYFCLVPLITY